MAQATVPDRRLAKVFNFTAKDLEANRKGYLTWRQRNHSEDWLVLLNRWWSQKLGGESIAQIERREGKVESVCGRIQVSYEQTQIQSFFHADFTETYSLTLEDQEGGFYITREQYLLLVNHQNISHKIYFLAESGVMLSIERGECS